MTIKILKSKLHFARVTEAQEDYVGSITIDKELMDSVGIKPYEQVLVTNKTNGNRLETYVIEGKKGSGEMCMNGPTAKLFSANDIIVVMAFTYMNDKELEGHKPKIAVLDKNNKITELIAE